MDCLTSKVGNALLSTIKDMISGMMKNVINAATCAVQQFIGGLVGKIIEFQGKDNKYIIIDNEAGSKIKLVKSSVSSLLEVKK